VKLPFRWPKNSLSISSAGIAPQLTGTKGPAARAPCSWMVRATSSLPTPDSPRMYTGAWLRATLAMVARRVAIAGESPSRRLACSGGGGGGFGRSALFSSSACRTRPRNTLMSTGLLTKSKAPAFSASTARSMLPKAVIIATGVCGWLREISPTSSMPLPSGRRMSVKHRS